MKKNQVQFQHIFIGPTCIKSIMKVIKCSYVKTTVTKSDESAYRSKRDTLYTVPIFSSCLDQFDTFYLQKYFAKKKEETC